MILRPFQRSAKNRTIAALYGAIVAQARLPAFYAAFGVPDTVQGRFDLIVLHLVLLLRRLAQNRDSERRLGQGLFDAFCSDLDDNLREMGVGDLAVPKEMRRFGEAFYGRQAAYLAALAGGDAQGLGKALARNIFQATDLDDRAARLARYVHAAVARLDGEAESALLGGEVAFPDPEASVNAQ